MAQDYYVAPLGGMDIGGEIGKTLGRVGERRRVDKMKQAAQDVMASGDPEQISRFMVANPEMQDLIKGASGFKSEATERGLVDLAKRGLSGDNPAELWQQHIGLIDAEGGDPSDSVEALGEALSDPEAARGRFERILAMYDPPAYASLLKTKPGQGKPYEGLTAGYEEYLRVNQVPSSPEAHKAYQDAQAANKKLLTNAAKERPFISQLMADGWLPSGRITGPQLDAFEAAAGKAIEQGKPFTVQDLRDMEFRAQKNKSTGAAAGSRLVIARKQNIEAAFSLVDDMQKTSAKLNYSPVKFIGALEKWKKGQTGDALFTEYMTQRSDSLFILGNALKQNGLTDKSIEVEEEAFSPTLAPEQFNAWLNVQKRALNRAAHEINTDYKYGIEPVGVYPAGQSGAPTPENPTPTLPAEAEHPATKYKEGQRAKLQDGSIVIFRNGNWGPS